MVKMTTFADVDTGSPWKWRSNKKSLPAGSALIESATGGPVEPSSAAVVE
jgi:hypothetical protein